MARDTVLPPFAAVKENVKKKDFNRSSAGNSITVELRIENRPGKFSAIVQHVAALEGSFSDVTLISSDFNHTVRALTINCKSEDHCTEIIESLEHMNGVTMIEWKDDTFEVHKGGKLEIIPRAAMSTTDELARVYTPGVARVCSAIHADVERAYQYTIKANTVAIVSDGSAVLGLGNIGAAAALPVMEGKAMLFKQFAGINGFPICLNTQDTEEIIATVKNISPVFGGINLEDISAPRCFEIENRLREELDIPVFHDDQHGTAVVVLAGLLNALKIIGKKLPDLRVVVNGFGAGGVACTRMLLSAGVKNIIPCDRAGIVFQGRKERMNNVKEDLSKITNPSQEQGQLSDALKGADVFIGVSEPGVLTRAMVKKMAKDPIVFALANPIPEILPGEIEDIVRVIATGRSDYANQVNNVLCFPGIFKGALESRAKDITDEMKIAAAHAIAECVEESQLREDYIIPGIFQSDVASVVADRVKKAAGK